MKLISYENLWFIVANAMQKPVPVDHECQSSERHRQNVDSFQGIMMLWGNAIFIIIIIALSESILILSRQFIQNVVSLGVIGILMDC